ncbi:hypothetical protein LTS12_016881 [Elasticomyces elasticus]|nr:hypothetical protein LTS12_016881 [Elasticomyces elasticus]
MEMSGGQEVVQWARHGDEKMAGTGDKIATDQSSTRRDETHTHDDYTVAWICPLEIEELVAVVLLDVEHPPLSQESTDPNAYTLGSMNGHNVVIAGLPTMGNSSAATVVAHMNTTFPQLRFGLVVGIGGGLKVPIRTKKGRIRLGHVVVSNPNGQHSGAVEYDRGKAEAGGFVRTGALAPPPSVLLNAVRKLNVARSRVRTQDPLLAHLQKIETSVEKPQRFRYPGADLDRLYLPDYVHSDREVSCRKCGCDAEKVVTDESDDSDQDGDDTAAGSIVVHEGTIAVGGKVMRNGVERDLLAKRYGVLCFEMEAAGAKNNFPCLIIRGISDYADSHKNDKWQPYAAAVAAAYARELFEHMPVNRVKECKIPDIGQ